MVGVKYPESVETVYDAVGSWIPRILSVHPHHITDWRAYNMTMLQHEEICRLSKKTVNLIAILPEASQGHWSEFGWALEQKSR